MKNKEVMYTIQLLGMLGARSQMIIVDKEKEYTVSSFLSNEKDIIICVDEDISLTADTYARYTKDKIDSNLDELTYSEKYEEVMALNVKAFIGDIMTENPFECQTKIIKSVSYSNNVFRLQI